MTRRLVRPVLGVSCCVAAAAGGVLAWYGSRLWLAIPLGIVGFFAAMFSQFFIQVGDVDVYFFVDWRGSLSTVGFLLVFSGAVLAVPVWYDDVTARPVEAVITADRSGAGGGPGSQHVWVEAADTGEDLGDLWFDADRDLAVGDRVVVYVDRFGWARVGDGTQDTVMVAVGWVLGAAGLAAFMVLVGSQVVADRREFRGREIRRDGR